MDSGRVRPRSPERHDSRSHYHHEDRDYPSSKRHEPPRDKQQNSVASVSSQTAPPVPSAAAASSARFTTATTTVGPVTSAPRELYGTQDVYKCYKKVKQIGQGAYGFVVAFLPPLLRLCSSFSSFVVVVQNGIPSELRRQEW